MLQHDCQEQIDCQLLMAVVLGLSERCLLCAVLCSAKCCANR